MNPILSEIRDQLECKADIKTKESTARYFREPVVSYGVRSPEVIQISKEYFKRISHKSKASVLDLCTELWASGYLEEAIIACNWSYYLRKSYEPADFPVFERWINTYVSNWAACDTLCNHTVGEFVMMYPDHLSYLKKFARSENRWVRRASSVSLIIPARRGLFLKDIFEIADIVLRDADDMVQKGYGWMLKAASQSHLEEVFNYVFTNKSNMPRTALRYAIEKMPAGMKAQAMMK